MDLDSSVAHRGRGCCGCYAACLGKHVFACDVACGIDNVATANELYHRVRDACRIDYQLMCISFRRQSCSCLYWKRASRLSQCGIAFIKRRVTAEASSCQVAWFRARRSPIICIMLLLTIVKRLRVTQCLLVHHCDS